MKAAVLILLSLLHLTVIKLATCKPPHIIFILADDLVSTIYMLLLQLESYMQVRLEKQYINGFHI